VFNGLPATQKWPLAHDLLSVITSWICSAAALAAAPGRKKWCRVCRRILRNIIAVFYRPIDRDEW
jgi:hypothetical protein